MQMKVSLIYAPTERELMLFKSEVETEWQKI